MMYATTFSYARDTEIPPSIVIFVDGHRRSESLTRTTNFLASFPRRFCLSSVLSFFLAQPLQKKWRMLIIGSAVNNHLGNLPNYLEFSYPHPVFTSLSLPNLFLGFFFFFFGFMKALLFAHIEWRLVAHATSYSEWNGLFWK